MNIDLAFDPVSEDLIPSGGDEDSWAETILINTGKPVKWQKKHIALIGLTEERGTFKNQGIAAAPDAIREQLYRLKKGSGNYNIVDLGNLRSGLNLQDSYDRLSTVCSALMQKNIVPIIIGSSHDMSLGQYAAYEYTKKLISVVNVDARIDVDEKNKKDHSAFHIHKLLISKPNYLFNFNHLAYQSYLNSGAALEVLETLYFDAYSVGQMRNDFNEVEPVVRQGDMLSFDIGAIKMNDAPGNAHAPALGLQAEEASQLCWFAGLSNKLSSIGFYEYNPVFDERRKTASLIAIMIWYFVEGYYHRVQEQDFEGNSFMKYVVSALDNSSNMVFFKHKVTQKWWMEVPYPSEIAGKQKTIMIPCSYKDYLTANKGEVPDRWINTYAKLV